MTCLLHLALGPWKGLFCTLSVLTRVTSISPYPVFFSCSVNEWVNPWDNEGPEESDCPRTAWRIVGGFSQLLSMPGSVSDRSCSFFTIFTLVDGDPEPLPFSPAVFVWSQTKTSCQTDCVERRSKKSESSLNHHFITIQLYFSLSNQIKSNHPAPIRITVIHLSQHIVEMCDKQL